MEKDMYTIHVNMPISRDKIISEIKSLSRPQVKKKETGQESEPLLLKTLGKKKDKKKKKKKSIVEGDFIISESTERENDVESRVDDILSDDNLIDVDELLYGNDSDEAIDEDIINDQRRQYDRLKKEENPFKKEFAEELTLLYNLLDELNKFGKDIEKKYKSLESSKVRGISKYTNELIASIITTKTSKLSILKEIANLKKIIADLKIKQDGKTKSDGHGGPGSMEQLASMYFQDVLKYGRNKFINNFRGAGKDDEVIDDLVEEIEERRRSYSDDELEDITNVIEERLENEENTFRSTAGSKYIEYEPRGVKIFIEKYVDTGEWEFVALDRNNQRVIDYPLPRKRDVGKVKFSDDGRHASDERGRTYKVIEVYSPDLD